MSQRRGLGFLLCALAQGTLISANAAELCVNGNPNLCCEEKGWGYEITSFNGTRQIKLSRGRGAYEKMSAARAEEEKKFQTECARDHGSGYFCNRTFGPLVCFEHSKKGAHQPSNVPPVLTWPAPNVSPSPTVSPSPRTIPSPQAGEQTPSQ